MTDADKILMLKVALAGCRELFSAIRDDWTDPRAECRAGWNLIDTVLAKVDEPAGVSPDQ